MRYRFDDFELDTDRYELRSGEEPVRVEPQVFEVLAHLVEHRDRVVTKHDLLDHVWGDRFVSESALSSRIKAARRAVGDDGTAQRVIRTVHCRGYQFVADVEAVDHQTRRERTLGDPSLEQEIRFCTTPGFLQDLETVVDAAGFDRFPLVGLSQGGPLAIAYARRHPERVSHLILIGAYAEGRLQRATTDEQRREAALQIEMARVGWGRDDPTFRRFFTSSFIPDGPPELWDAFAELLRRTTSADNAGHLIETWSDIDVTAEAAALDVPTLILHARDEVRVPFEQARVLAGLIPGSRLVPLDSRNHLLRGDEPAFHQLLDEIDAFLARDDGA